MSTRTRLIHWAPDPGFPLKTACGAGKGPRLVDTVTEAAALITCRRCQQLLQRHAAEAADRLLSAFAWCGVCGSQHHPDSSTCDGLRGGTTDRLAAPTLAADLPAAAGADSPIAAALSVLVLDPRIRAYLASHDPQALRQAATALHGVGLRYQPADGPADLCWYCFLPLTRNGDGETVCRDCRHAGRAVRPQQLEGDE